MKPCVVGIVLATGLFFVFRNCFGELKAFSVDACAIIMTFVLSALYFGSRKVLKGGISPIGLIGISALAGMLVYGWH